MFCKMFVPSDISPPAPEKVTIPVKLIACVGAANTGAAVPPPGVVSTA